MSLSDFFQIGAMPINAMPGSYVPWLVILSYIVAVFASYIALDMTGRLRDPHNSSHATIGWLCGGAFAMGAGIWSMHFIGMLAFKMDMPMSYDLQWTLLSMAIAMLASFFALFLLKVHVINVPRLALGGVILGLGIAAMHYTGMEAMRISMNIHYLPGLFALSILIAIFASEAALWLALKSNRSNSKYRLILKSGSALIMGAAICGMHYTGMFAAVFTPIGHIMNSAPTIEPQLLAIGIAGVTFIILGIAFFLSLYREAMTAQQLNTARQAGMTEVATSVLHNVGNTLNSVNVSINLIAEKIQTSRLDGLTKLSQLISDHQHNLGTFLSDDERGKKIPDYIQGLATCWQEDQEKIKHELNTLIKNVEHIKKIINLQQEMGKIADLSQWISLQELIDETLIIAGLNHEKSHIAVTTHREFSGQLYLDKNKLLQILINLLQNAKEAVIASEASYKTIEIKLTQPDKTQCDITIKDNGIGIPTENLIRIFSYGFTTKKSGHGFGLHSCALSANELGGSLQAHSDGPNKGSTFILRLPT